MPLIKRFDEVKTYSDFGSVNQLCRDLLDQGEGKAGRLQVGTCEITGPGQVAEDAHQTWTQYFLVTKGAGTLYLDGQPHPFSTNMIAEIPKNTKHYVRCEFKQSIQYFFINIHD